MDWNYLICIPLDHDFSIFNSLNNIQLRAWFLPSLFALDCQNEISVSKWPENLQCPFLGLERWFIDSFFHCKNQTLTHSRDDTSFRNIKIIISRVIWGIFVTKHLRKSVIIVKFRVSTRWEISWASIDMYIVWDLTNSHYPWNLKGDRNCARGCVKIDEF